jgi:hypothetical protein
MAEREITCTLEPRRKATNQLVDIAGLIPDSGEHREFDIAGEPRLAPGLYRDAADDAEAPVAALAELLDFPAPLRGGD